MVHTWSIAVEFQMYLITPPFMLLAHHLSARCAMPATPVYMSVMGVGWLLCVCGRAFSINETVGGADPYNFAPWRVAPYFAGVAASVAVRQHASAPYSFPGPAARAIFSVLAWLVLLLAASLGAEPSYFVQETPYGAAYATQWRSVFRAHVALGRPLVGLAVAYLLATSLTGHAPRLAAALGHPCWRPLAALSYSMYLLQYVGSKLAWPPVSDPIIALIGIDTVHGPLWYGALLSHAKGLVTVAATLPLATLNYCLVERPLHLHGRDAALCIAGACAGSAAPTLI